MAMERQPSGGLVFSGPPCGLAAPVSTAVDAITERTAEPVVAEISGAKFYGGNSHGNGAQAGRRGGRPGDCRGKILRRGHSPCSRRQPRGGPARRWGGDRLQNVRLRRQATRGSAGRRT